MSKVSFYMVISLNKFIWSNPHMFEREYVDDLVIIGNNVKLVTGLKKQLEITFEMTDLGSLNFFLGIQVLHMDDGIFISQPKYVWNILEKFIWKTINHFLCLTNRE
jgi:hypothetical protein